MKSLIITITILWFSLPIFAINIDVQSTVFFANSPYVELQIRIDGKSVEWSGTSHELASVELIVLVSDANGTIAAADKFVLNSPTAKDSIDFIAARRFKINAGNYTLHVEARDINKNENKIELEQKLVVRSNDQKFNLSDIQLLGDFRADTIENELTKNGFYMESLPYNHCDKNRNQLYFYVESYMNTPLSGETYVMQYSIMEGFKDRDSSNQLFVKYKKLAQNSIIPELLNLSLEGVKTGDYHLSVNILDKSKKILASQKTNFTRSNPAADIVFLENYNEDVSSSFVQKIKSDEMDYILKAHIPITDQSQMSTLEELIKSNRIKSQRQFIYQLWKYRNPKNPQDDYSKYMEVVKAVDKKFYENVGYGFQSDRGYIFLKHGKPNNVITVDTELDAPPYEIWYYNYLPTTRQTNVRFIFYNPSLVHNNFKLLHSTCLGERSNRAWETVLYGSLPAERKGNPVDATQVGDNWNRNARKLFNEL